MSFLGRLTVRLILVEQYFNASIFTFSLFVFQYDSMAQDIILKNYPESLLSLPELFLYLLLVIVLIFQLIL